MPSINSVKILILATDGYERSKLRTPLDELRRRGAGVRLASIKEGAIKSWDKTGWGDSIEVDLQVRDVLGDRSILTCFG